MRNIACNRRYYRIFVDEGDVVKAEQAIRALKNKDNIRDYASMPILLINAIYAEKIADLITRQQAVCDAARKVIEYDLLPNDYADVCCHCKNQKQDCAKCRKYCPCTALNDALKRLEDKP